MFEYTTTVDKFLGYKPKPTEQEQYNLMVEEIKNLRTKMDKKIDEYVSMIPEGTREEGLKWINENVEPAYVVYVRLKFLGVPFDPFMKSSKKYKSLGELGLVNVRPKNCPNIEKRDEELSVWKKRASHIAVRDIRIIDTHAHYDEKAFNDVRNEVLTLIHEACVDKCIIPAIKYASNERMMKYFDKDEYYWIKYSIGSHPKYIHNEIWDDERKAEFEQLISHGKVVAIGETGLDYSGIYDEDIIAFQSEMFRYFIRCANKYKLPLILHVRRSEDENCKRDAYEDALEIIRQEHIDNGAVLHCFNGNADVMNKFIEAGVQYFGIGGKVFENKELENAVKKMDDSNLLLETDSPYVKVIDEPFPNTSLSLFDIVIRLTDIRETVSSHIIEVTNKNAMRLFNI